MPWETFRKKLSIDSSSGGGPSKRRDSQQLQQQQQQQQQYQQPQRLAQHDQRSPPVIHQPAFATVVTQAVAARNQPPQQRASTSYPVQQDHVVTSPRAARALPPDVYQKIKEVDQEPSTLTTSGVKGLSARVLDKCDYSQAMPDGTLQTYSCQTVELYKRPGQSLGLFLREGNNEDRFDGIFVSRVQEGSDLRSAGVLFAGDEILSVNTVDVTQKNIDEVVVMISIPRRLLLRTRTIHRPRGEGASSGMRDDLDSGKFIKPLDSTGSVVVNKPIAIIKQMPRDDSRESTMTDDGATLASSQLMTTAQTSLGVKARQQESTSSLSDSNPHYAGTSARPGMAPYRAASALGTMAHQSRPRERNPVAQRSLSDRWNYGRQFPTMQTGRPESEEFGVSGNEGEIGEEVWRRARGGQSSEASAGYQSTLANTAYLPPPRLQGHLPTLDRATSGMDPSTVGGGGDPNPAIDPFQMTPPVPSVWNPQQTALAQSDYAESSIFSPRSVASDSRLATVGAAMQPPPRSVLRQPSAFPTSFFPSIKSNSLPRRHPAGRTIKWRNDVMVGGPDTALSSSAVSPASGYYPPEMSELDGALSVPNLAFSPGSAYLPNPTYPLPRTPTSGKTIDDVFSRSEYQAWTRYPGLPPQSVTDRYGNPLTSPYRAYDNQRPYMQMSSQSRPSPYARLEGPALYMDYMAQSGGTMARGEAPSAYWTRRHDQDPMYGSGPAIPMAAPPVLPRMPKTRSSSLPPRGILNQPGGPGYDFDERIYENVQNFYGGDMGTFREPGIYGVDVSPLPRRRMPLNMAAANPSFGYESDMPIPGMDTGPGPSEGMAATLTGILFLRVIEGRQIRSRDPEEMYCVVEVDGEHRARTEVSDWQSAFRWNEMFEIDIWEGRRAEFYIYSWHPQYRHKLRHRGSLLLMETLLSQSKYGQVEELDSQTNHSFALNLDPRGQLIIQIGFYAMSMAYRRQLATRRSSYWGVPLEMLVEREASIIVGGGNVPTVFRRLIQEIERRGVDTTGLYVLCGSSSKKFLLRDQLEREPALTDLSPDAVPDLNILTSILKDFLRELPEPLVPNCTFQMLLDAWKVCVPNDKEGNAKLMLGVIDCLTTINKCTFMVLMDHLKYVISQSPHNGLSATKCGCIFGPLVFCTSQAYPLTSRLTGNEQFPPKPFFSFLDHRLAARLMEVLLELWPSPRSSSESSGSENSTVNLTGNGNTSLVDLWLQENRLPESNC